MKTGLDKHLIAQTAPYRRASQEFIVGNLRFTVIAPELLRVEYDPKCGFCDEATQTVWFRDLGECRYELKFEDKHVVVETEKAKFYFNRRKKKVEFVELDGERIPADNRDNLRGTARTLDMSFGKIPLDKGVIGRRGVAVMEDNSLILGADGEVKARNPEKDYYVFACKDYRRTLELFYAITGPAPMVPRYALGNWWSRYKAYTQEEYLGLINRFEEAKIPFTVATVDMDWHYTKVKQKFGFNSMEGAYVFQRGWTGYTWNEELFPDYRAFLAELKAKNMHVTLNLHPAAGVRSFEVQYADFCTEMGLDPTQKRTIPFDITSTAFLNAYFKILHKPYEREGVDFWWIDWQQGKKSALAGYDPLWACNHYHTLDAAADGKRPLILSRYAGLGSHRYPLGFSGDSTIIWNVLKFQPFFTVNAANAGYTAWSHDIGGHNMGHPACDELYLRWVQSGVFSPILRLHSSNMVQSKEPWNHPTVEEETKQMLRLRHSLIPYIYTAYYHNYADSVPVCEPLYYRYPDKSMAHSFKNEYFFGSELIVAPITSPVDKKTGKAKVKIWIPEGLYTDIFTGEQFTGGTYTVERDLKSLPVLAKQGAVIPLARSVGNDCSNPKELDLLVFSGNNAYTLYEDDGESMGYTRGENAQTTFTVADCGDELVFKIGAAEGDLSLLPAERKYNVDFRTLELLHGMSVSVNGAEYPFTVNESIVTIENIKPTDSVEIRIVGKK